MNLSLFRHTVITDGVDRAMIQYGRCEVKELLGEGRDN